MALSRVRVSSFGADKVSLATVGYQLYLSDGTTSGSRVTAGIYALGGGTYGANVSHVDAIVTAGGSIKWDTGETAPLYATEGIVPSDFINVLAAGQAAANVTHVNGGAVTPASTLVPAIDVDGNSFSVTDA